MLNTLQIINNRTALYFTQASSYVINKLDLIYEISEVGQGCKIIGYSENFTQATEYINNWEKGDLDVVLMAQA